MSQVVGQSPTSKDMNMEAEDSIVLGVITKPTIGKIQQTKKI
jgi:hypothetical protein